MVKERKTKQKGIQSTPNCNNARVKQGIPLPIYTYNSYLTKPPQQHRAIPLKNSSVSTILYYFYYYYFYYYTNNQQHTRFTLLHHKQQQPSLRAAYKFSLFSL